MRAELLPCCACACAMAAGDVGPYAGDKCSDAVPELRRLDSDPPPLPPACWCCADEDLLPLPGASKLSVGGE